MWIRRCAAGSAPAVSPIVHARSAQVGIGERESRRGWGQQLVVRGQLHSPMVKLVMRVAHVAPIRARCFNSKRTSFHVALELEHVESVDLRSAIRKADAVLPAFARAGQRGDTLKRVARQAGVVCCFDSGCNTSLLSILGPVAPARRAAHGTSRKVAGGRRMEPSGSGSASLSLGPLRARPSGRLLSRRSAQQGKRARRRCASTQLYGVLRQAPLHAR